LEIEIHYTFIIIITYANILWLQSQQNQLVKGLIDLFPTIDRFLESLIIMCVVKVTLSNNDVISNNLFVVGFVATEGVSNTAGDPVHVMDVQILDGNLLGVRRGPKWMIANLVSSVPLKENGM
jgi:hypothetical protein